MDTAFLALSCLVHQSPCYYLLQNTVLLPARNENRNIKIIEIINLTSLEINSFHIIAPSILKLFTIELFAKIFNG